MKFVADLDISCAVCSNFPHFFLKSSQTFVEFYLSFTVQVSFYNAI